MLTFNLEFTASFAMSAASKIYLFWMKACWYSEATSPTASFNLLANNIIIHILLKTIYFLIYL